MSGAFAATTLVALAAATLAHAVTCPARIQYEPGTTLGWTSDTVPNLGTYTFDDQIHFFQGPSSLFSSDCCPTGTIANWTLAASQANGYLGQVTAQCTDGTRLMTTTLGFNGSSSAANCSSDLMNGTTIADNGQYTARTNTPIYELLGVGNVTDGYNSSETDFQCASGLVPIGFGARSGCNSVTDFKVICAPPYGSLPPSSGISSKVNNCSRLANLQAIPTAQEIGQAEVMPNATYNVSVDTSLPLSYANPYYVNYYGPFVSDCCDMGYIVNWTISRTNWTGLVANAQFALVGELAAVCSDGNILAPITYGYNGSATSDCRTRGQYLAHFDLVPNPSDNNYVFRTGSQLDGFILPAASGNPFNATCPPGTQPIGFGAASNCLSLVLPQVYCGVPPAQAMAPAPAPSNSVGGSFSGPSSSGGSSGISGGAIAGIVIGVVVGLALITSLAMWLALKKKRQRKQSDTSKDRLVAMGNSGASSWRGTGSSATSGRASGPLTYYSTDESGGMTLVPYTEVSRQRDTIAIEDLELPVSNSTSFEGLPSRWQIPVASVSLVCQNNTPVELGSGGFGYVYKGIVRREEAAIKIVRGGSSREHARLLHEIIILEQAKSSCIVQFLGYSIATDDLLLCMEFMPGGTLFDSLGRTGEYQWHEGGRQAAKDIAAGLFCLHDQGVAHLDVKSNNILIGRDRRVKLADLGLGKLGADSAISITQMGTVNWMAPEFIISGTCSTASDIYSFGTVLYEICTLKRPKPGLNTSEIQVPDQASAELVQLITECRAIEPEQRPVIKAVCDRLDAMA